MSIKYIVMKNFSISCYDRSVNPTKQKHKNIIFTCYIKHIWHILLSMIYVKCYKSFFCGLFLLLSNRGIGRNDKNRSPLSEGLSCFFISGNIIWG